MRAVPIAVLTALAACGQPTAINNDAVTVASPPASGWATRLTDLLPSIDACLVDSPTTRWVSFAGEHDNATLVRLAGAGGAIDCRIAIQSTPTGAMAQITDIRPRDTALIIADENTAIFVRGPGDNPGGECYEAPEVRSTGGELLGWMADPLGC